MVKNHDTTWLNCTKDVVATTPGQVSDGLLSSLHGWESLPALVRSWALGAHHLALPHDDETVLGATTQDALLGVVGDRVDLVIEELALEG